MEQTILHWLLGLTSILILIMFGSLVSPANQDLATGMFSIFVPVFVLTAFVVGVSFGRRE